MFEWLLQFLRETVEWRAWGWNLSTYGTIGAIGLALFQGVGVWKQGCRVHREREAQTLSFVLFGYSMAYLFSASLYGMEKKSIALAVLAVNGFLHIPVVTGIPRYRFVPTREKWIVGTFLLMVPLMCVAITVRLHEVMFLIFLFGLLGFMAPQAYRAWKSSDTSDLNLTMILSLLFGALFWFVYGVMVVDSWALKLFNPPAFVLWAFILVMWWKKGRGRQENEDDPGEALMRIVYGLGAAIILLFVAIAAGAAYLIGLI